MSASDRVSDLRVIFVGDAIMDEYLFVKTIGKAVKENALSAMAGSRELYKGGVWAAANTCANFVSRVDVLHGQHTMWNVRLVDDVYLRKLFVIHELKSSDDDPHHYDLRDYDMVVVCDFGHGTMTKGMIERVTREARFLAVNCQTNSTNYGFNMITKYPRADYVVVDELEARLAARDRDSPVEDVILKLGFERIVVTRGTRGAVGFDGAFERHEAYTDKVVDTMGAGDAFLAVTAPYAACGASMKEILRIGNAAGAAKTGIVGHRTSVHPKDIERFVHG